MLACLPSCLKVSFFADEGNNRDILFMFQDMDYKEMCRNQKNKGVAIVARW